MDPLRWNCSYFSFFFMNNHDHKHTSVYIIFHYFVCPLYISFYSMVEWYLLIFVFFYASTTVHCTVHCTCNKTSIKTPLIWTLILTNKWLVSNGLTKSQCKIKFEVMFIFLANLKYQIQTRFSSLTMTYSDTAKIKKTIWLQ